MSFASKAVVPSDFGRQQRKGKVARKDKLWILRLHIVIQKKAISNCITCVVCKICLENNRIICYTLLLI